MDIHTSMVIIPAPETHGQNAKRDERGMVLGQHARSSWPKAWQVHAKITDTPGGVWQRKCGSCDCYISRLVDNDTQSVVSNKKPITLRDTRKQNDDEFVDNGVDGGDDDDDNLGYNQHWNENFHRA